MYNRSFESKLADKFFRAYVREFIQIGGTRYSVMGGTKGKYVYDHLLGDEATKDGVYLKTKSDRALYQFLEELDAAWDSQKKAILSK